MARNLFNIFFAAILMFASCQAPVTAPDDPEQQEQQQPEDQQPEPEPQPQPQPEPEPETIASIYITTPSGKESHSKDYWLEGATITLVKDEQHTQNLGTTAMKLRGNSSLWYPKKSYNLKFENKLSVLGMPASKRWCLLACWMDRTMLRNDVAFEISRRTGLAWTPRGKFVKLYINDRYDGLYYFVEKIKIAKNRVNISDDGYIVELDSYYDEVNKFRSSIVGLPVNFKEPDEDLMTEEKFKAFQNFFNETEELIVNRNPAYRDNIDIDSFIDWLFVQELCENAEPNHPKSSYLYKDVSGKLYAGPTWDHDWYTFVPYVTYYTAANTIWYKYLFQDEYFVGRVVDRWNSQKEGFKTIPEYIDKQAGFIYDIAVENCKQWPITQTVNGDESMEFIKAVSRMRESYIQRYNWLDKQINSLK